MKFRDLQTVKADPMSVSVDVRYSQGRFEAEVYYDRTLRNGDVQPVELRLRDLTPAAIRCIASSLNDSLEQWSNDWHKTAQALRGDE